jgi:hypothetical protein
MQEVVKIGKATVSVRDDLAVSAVCIRCKGFKTVYRTSYFSSDPYFWMGYKIICPLCYGRGLYLSSS